MRQRRIQPLLCDLRPEPRAGGGGFLLTYSARGDKSRLRKAMQGFREMPFFLERYGSKVNYNAEGYEWD